MATGIPKGWTRSPNEHSADGFDYERSDGAKLEVHNHWFWVCGPDGKRLLRKDGQIRSWSSAAAAMKAANKDLKIP